jgi:hypothetical protein
MTDPLCIAAGVAGVLSLGLEFCKGIINYCDAWWGWDTEIANLTLKAEQLSHTLSHLRGVSDDAEGLDLALTNNIRGIALSNSAQIIKLDERLVKCGVASGQATGFHDKVRDVVRKARYPLAREMLLRMQDLLSELQTNLHTALHVRLS